MLQLVCVVIQSFYTLVGFVSINAMECFHGMLVCVCVWDGVEIPIDYFPICKNWLLFYSWMFPIETIFSYWLYNISMLNHGLPWWQCQTERVFMSLIPYRLPFVGCLASLRLRDWHTANNNLYATFCCSIKSHGEAQLTQMDYSAIPMLHQVANEWHALLV